MKNVFLKSGLFAAIVLIAVNVNAAEIKNFSPKSKTPNNTYYGGANTFANTCKPASAKAELDINNVRTLILNGGDMWWDLNNPKYEIPKLIEGSTETRKHALFAGSLWIGGISRGDGNLRIAAMTYRQTGNDYFPGTLDTNGVSTDPARCESWNKMFRVNKSELLAQQNSNNVIISQGILDWPARGNSSVPMATNQTEDLAPFFDRATNGGPGTVGIYEPQLGDYPVLDDTKDPSKNLPKDQPDQMIWFVYNDRGNVHSETGGIPIGLELQTTAFAYQTLDELNNTTFYRTKIVNRGFEALDNTYFGQWVDADLGNYSDDYVGCDVTRSLGYCYNGDDNDEGVLGYGLNPPSIGVDFFEGPKDSLGNTLGMGAFIYYNNNSDPINGNPNNALDFYNYLQAKWQNGNCVTYGGNGVGGSVCTKYMFDDGTNPATSSLPRWNERSSGNTPSDRRFLQSAGPFSLFHGAVNNVTVAVVWAKANKGGATGSLNLLKRASDKAQEVYDNKFSILGGPQFAETNIESQELENQVVIKVLNSEITEKYEERFVKTLANNTKINLDYKFQGYMIYQLKNGSVSNSELDDIDKAVLVAQCDIKDAYSTLINREFDNEVGLDIPKLKVTGNNIGLNRTFSIKEDAFAMGSNKTLVNYKTYYFLVIPYGNCINDPNFDPANPTDKPETWATSIQYLPSNTPVKISLIPHKIESEAFGSNTQAKYGDGPAITQIKGRGNGGQILEFSDETINDILKNNKAATPTYLGGKGPIHIKVVDPLKVPKANFEFKFIEPTNLRVAAKGTLPWQDSISQRSWWVLTNLTTNESVYSDTTINNKVETVQGRFPFKGPTKLKNNLNDWGLAVEVQQVKTPGRNPHNPDDATNGLLSYNVTFADPSNQWLTAVIDNDNTESFFQVPFNWIRSGTKGLKSATPDLFTDDMVADFDNTNDGIDSYDPNEVFEKIWDRRIAPYALCSRVEGTNAAGRIAFGMAWKNNAINDNPLLELSSIKLVMTSDVRKWTKCVVLEMGEDKTLTEGNMEKFNMRWHNSVKPIYNTSTGEFIRWQDDPSERGRSYFPGYAVNLETGERLNIMFGEDSYLPNDNGSDMIWNPTSSFLTSNNYFNFGGKHYIYIMGSYNGMTGRNFKGPIYDEGSVYASSLAVAAPNTNPNTTDKRRVFSQAMWVIPSMATPGFNLKNGVPPNDVSISINMRKPYNKFSPDTSAAALPKYTFNTEGVYNNENKETGKKSVSTINVVPNPYYATSEYESGPIDNKVKFTNLPPKCTISIFTLSGTLVRKIKKDDLTTYADWDLKNDSRVPIGSGLYIIHVDCGDLGEKILKWYGVIRQLDLDTY